MRSLESFGRRIRALRIEQNMTQQDLANSMFVSRKTIGNWESGNRLPDITMLARLARHLGVTTSELLDEMDDEEEDSPIVIVVEQEPQVLAAFVSLISDILPESQVFGFDTLSEALQFAEKHRVAIAFIDVELHENSSFVLAKMLQNVQPRINIIFLTWEFTKADEAWGIHPSGCVLMPLTAQKIRLELQNLRFPVRNLK